MTETNQRVIEGRIIYSSPFRDCSARLSPKATTKLKRSREDKRRAQGACRFGAMDEVVFGRPPPRRCVAQMDRLGAHRAFLMVSGTLNRETDEIEKIRRRLAPAASATFDAMPPHTPREAVIAAAEQARARQRRSHRHGRRRLDHRRRQGGAALPRQRRPHASRRIDRIRVAQRRRAADMNAPIGAPDQRADDDCRRRVQRHRRRHQRAHQGQGDAAPSI